MGSSTNTSPPTKPLLLGYRVISESRNIIGAVKNKEYINQLFNSFSLKKSKNKAVAPYNGLKKKVTYQIRLST